MMMRLLIIIYYLSFASQVFSFLGKPKTFYQSRHVLYIDEEIAKMIDNQLWRQNHRSEVEAMWHKKNAHVLDKNLPGGVFDLTMDMKQEEQIIINRRQLERDRRLARLDPTAYCADRCIATGNCDVYEDYFRLSPVEVVAFCRDCILGDGDDPCDIPPQMLEEGLNKLKP